MKFLSPFAVLFFGVLAASSTASVSVEALPEQGLQPDLAMSADGGMVNLVYLTGEPGRAEVHFASRKLEGPWSRAVKVNAEASPAIALGSIRGPQLALGAGGAVHVLWNGASTGSPPRASLWYARSTTDGAKFEAPLNLLGDTTGLDGGASIATDGKSAVHVVWHALPAGKEPGEINRQVFIASSSDAGATFAAAVVAKDSAPGVCGCCALKAIAGPEEPLRIFFRNATTADHRAMTFLSLKSGGDSISNEVEPWLVKSCPMSSASLQSVKGRTLGAWETEGSIRLGWLDASPKVQPVTASGKNAKHPCIARGKNGNFLLAWVEGTGWNKGGNVAWQEFDVSLKPVGTRGTAEGVPAWGRAAAYAKPNGDYVILR